MAARGQWRHRKLGNEQLNVFRTLTSRPWQCIRTPPKPDRIPVRTIALSPRRDRYANVQSTSGSFRTFYEPASPACRPELSEEYPRPSKIRIRSRDKPIFAAKW